jgi:hypothetical protein
VCAGRERERSRDGFLRTRGRFSAVPTVPGRSRDANGSREAATTKPGRLLSAPVLDQALGFDHCLTVGPRHRETHACLHHSRPCSHPGRQQIAGHALKFEGAPHRPTRPASWPNQRLGHQPSGARCAGAARAATSFPAAFLARPCIPPQEVSALDLPHAGVPAPTWNPSPAQTQVPHRRPDLPRATSSRRPPRAAHACPRDVTDEGAEGPGSRRVVCHGLISTGNRCPSACIASTSTRCPDTDGCRPPTARVRSARCACRVSGDHELDQVGAEGELRFVLEDVGSRR